MQNKRSLIKRENFIYRHIINNLKNYIIVTIMFLVGVVVRCTFYKQC